MKSLNEGVAYVFREFLQHDDRAASFLHGLLNQLRHARRTKPKNDIYRSIFRSDLSLVFYRQAPDRGCIGDASGSFGRDQLA